MLRISVLLLSTSHCSLITILKRSNATAHLSFLAPGTSASTHTDENAIVHGGKPNCPAPGDGIGPTSERDPSAENAVHLNFNDNISDNGLTIVDMSATTSIYSQCSENSKD
jgi:hypothetical protein